MQAICAICQKRISDWMLATGKTKIIGNDIFHKACLMDKNNDAEQDGA